MKFTIPKTFECGGRTITVVRAEMLDDLPSDRDGDWRASNAMIRVIKSKEMPIDSQNQTFWHEAFHCILETAGHSKLSGDEDFVERISQLIYQVVKTGK
jgi:hypothetical protein